MNDQSLKWIESKPDISGESVVFLYFKVDVVLFQRLEVITFLFLSEIFIIFKYFKEIVLSLFLKAICS